MFLRSAATLGTAGQAVLRKKVVRCKSGAETNLFTVGRSEAPFTAFWLHGLLGSNANWVKCAREIAAKCVDWKFVLPQLRNHCLGKGRLLTSPPHTVKHCAIDLVHLSESLGIRPHAVMGHSFGGKVALEYLRITSSVPRYVWLLDTLPGPTNVSSFSAGGLAGGAMLQMLQTVKELPDSFSSKDVVASALAACGADSRASKWIMDMVVADTDGQGFRFNFDVQTVEELLLDYLTTDSSDVMRDSACKVHMVVARNSDRWNYETLSQLDKMAESSGGQLRIHSLDNVGHWIHADSCTDLCHLMSTDLT